MAIRVKTVEETSVDPDAAANPADAMIVDQIAFCPRRKPVYRLIQAFDDPGP